MTPAEQRQAVIAICLAVADAKATHNPKLFQWAAETADKELLSIIPNYQEDSRPEQTIHP